MKNPLAQETIEQLQCAPLDDRIQAIEVLLGTLKSDIPRSKPTSAMQKLFTVHTFNLGTDIHPDREGMAIACGDCRCNHTHLSYMPKSS